MHAIQRSTRYILGAAKRRPLRANLMVLGILALAGLPWFFLPKTVEFSYAGDTCVNELTVLPQLHRQAAETGYEVSFEGVKSVSGRPLLATSVCFIPQQQPDQGEVDIATSPWGGWLAAQRYSLVVGAEPRADVAALARPVPTTKPIEVPLDQPDKLHDYELIVDKRSTSCEDDADATLHCGIEQLELAQGKKYRYELVKRFNDAKSEAVSSGTLETLRAVKVVKTDVKKGQTVYAKPSKFRLTLDKPLANAKASLKTRDKTEDIDVTTQGRVVTVAFDKPLKRQADYSLILESADATDGSTLVEPYEVSFMMSGGPKVSNISIGGSRVDLNARAVITFDQELSSKQDIASLISVKGVKAAVSKLSPKQVAVQLSGAGRCQPFTVTLAGGALSKYDIKNDQSWSHKSRTICYTTTVYGTSLQGRPLVAYHFGNSGPLTLYTGAIHGNEISSKFMMESWIAELEASPDKIGSRRVVIIPAINPDGVAAGTRNNSRNVNLSRNFPTSSWVKDIDDTDGPNKGGGGTRPLSEPEAAALARFTQSLGPRLLVSYHAIGSLVVGDGRGTYSGGKAAEYASLTGYRNATGEGGTFDYDITGAYEDWTYRNIGIPSMIVELGSYSYHDFSHHRSAMWAMLD